jgi:hypothetical protein
MACTAATVAAAAAAAVTPSARLLHAFWTAASVSVFVPLCLAGDIVVYMLYKESLKRSLSDRCTLQLHRSLALHAAALCAVASRSTPCCLL